MAPHAAETALSDISRHRLSKTSEGVLWYQAQDRSSRSIKSCKLRGGASMDRIAPWSSFDAHEPHFDGGQGSSWTLISLRLHSLICRKH